MLADETRVRAYSEAIRRVVSSGSRVLDLGAGTGVWSAAALLAGAKEVVAVEPTDAISLARALLAENGLSDRVRFVHAHLHEVEEDLRREKPFDVIVSEMMGDLLVEEDYIPILRRAQTLLAEGGVQIPREAEWIAAPVALEEAEARTRFWRRGVSLPGLGVFAAESAAKLAEHAPILVAFPTCLAGPPQTLVRLKTDALPERNELRGEAVFEVDRTARVTGVGLWWRATLAPGVTISTGPDDPPTHWGRTVFPLPPANLSPGDRFRFSLHAVLSPRPQTWVWRAEGAIEARRTTFEAAIVGPERLAKLRGPDDEDRPVAGGELARLGRLLLLLDGTRTFGEAVDAAARRPGGRDPAWTEDPRAEARRLLYLAASRLKGLR